MKKIKITTILIILAIGIFVVKKNSISNSSLNYIVLCELNNILEEQNNLLIAEGKNLPYKTSYTYEHYTNLYGKDIVNDSSKLQNIIEKEFSEKYWLIY